MQPHERFAAVVVSNRQPKQPWQTIQGGHFGDAVRDAETHTHRVL